MNQLWACGGIVMMCLGSGSLGFSIALILVHQGVIK